MDLVRARLLDGDDRGASLVEYALLLALITVVCIGAVAFFGAGGVGASLEESGSSLFAP